MGTGRIPVMACLMEHWSGTDCFDWFEDKDWFEDGSEKVKVASFYFRICRDIRDGTETSEMDEYDVPEDYVDWFGHYEFMGDLLDYTGKIWVPFLEDCNENYGQSPKNTMGFIAECYRICTKRKPWWHLDRCYYGAEKATNLYNIEKGKVISNGFNTK